MAQVIGYKNKIYPKGTGGGGSGSNVEPNPQDTPTDTLETIGIDGTVYNIAGGGGGGNALIMDAQIYSEDEQVVGVWTDNKPLYQKTWTGLTITPAYNTWTNIIQVSDIDKIIAWEGRDNGTVCLNGTGLEISYNSATQYVRGEYTQNSNVRLVETLTLQYTKTTDTAGSGGYQAYGFSPVIYSTEEREIGVWTDNKPLYRKVFDFSSSPISLGSSWANTSISSTDIDKVVTVRAFHSDGTVYEEINADPTRSNHTWVGVRGSGTAYYLMLEYTKLSDTAGSGSYNTLGVPTVHYTTDEQVIGTYTDGNGVSKPVYQKTQIGGISLTSVGVWYDTSFTNIDQVLDVKGTILRDDEQINLGYFTNTLGTCWICRNNNIKIQLAARNSGETYALDKLTIQYTKTTDV